MHILLLAVPVEIIKVEAHVIAIPNKDAKTIKKRLISVHAV